ncbi:MAG TPA: FKBP-type peptidyl-prolyl cis-trans isomerase [Caulobacteraceae bacterium]|jgi:peptidylprolyl isomerase/FKBP-type peptidyl-prolyl cis-trans isomerase FklB
MKHLPLAALAALALSACGGGEPAQAQNQPIAMAPAPGANQGSEPAAAFLAKNALAEGVKSLPSGLQYQVLKSGPAGGKSPILSDQVTVHYEAILPSGEVLDSSYERGEPSTFPLRGLVKAWEEALPMMKPGDQWLLWAPPELGYGAEGKGPVPPGAVLKFRIELIRVN